MQNNALFAGLVFVATGIALVVIYSLVARMLFGVKLDWVQTVLYKVNTDTLPIHKQFIEVVFRILKFLGLLFIVVGAFSPFI